MFKQIILFNIFNSFKKWIIKVLYSVIAFSHYNLPKQKQKITYAYWSLMAIWLSRSLMASMSLEKCSVRFLSKATSIEPNSVTASEILPLSISTSLVIPSIPKFLSSSKSEEIFHMWCSSDSALEFILY